MPTVVYGDFEWDSNKAAENAAKHGVTFEDAATVFAGPMVAIVDDGSGTGRCAAIGLSMGNRSRLLYIVHVERGDRDRIISAR